MSKEESRLSTVGIMWEPVLAAPRYVSCRKYCVLQKKLQVQTLFFAKASHIFQNELMTRRKLYDSPRPFTGAIYHTHKL